MWRKVMCRRRRNKQVQNKVLCEVDDHYDLLTKDVMFEDNVKKIESYLKVKPEAIEACNARDYTPLQFAIFKNREDVIDFLLDRGADVNNHYNMYCTTPLHTALMSPNINTIDKLLQRGAYVNATTTHGETPLHYMGKDDPAIIHLFYIYGANLNITDYYTKTLLSHHIVRKNTGNALALLAYTSDINSQIYNNYTSLYYACLSGSPEIVSELLKVGADPGIICEGETCYEVARRCSLPCYEILMSHKALSVN